VAKVQHYRGLNTNLDRLYEKIKQELQDQKDIEIVSEYKGTMNSIPLRSIVAVNKSPKVWAGSLREIHVSITGNPNDYAVEVASGAWFGSFHQHIAIINTHNTLHFNTTNRQRWTTNQTTICCTSVTTILTALKKYDRRDQIQLLW
jgi:hypothetical protein